MFARRDKKDMEHTIKVIKYLAAKGARIHARTFMSLPQTHFVLERAGRVAPKLRKEIHNLVSNGMSFGDRLKQGRIARKTETYLKSIR